MIQNEFQISVCVFLLSDSDFTYSPDKQIFVKLF